MYTVRKIKKRAKVDLIQLGQPTLRVVKADTRRPVTSQNEMGLETNPSVGNGPEKTAGGLAAVHVRFLQSIQDKNPHQ